MCELEYTKADWAYLAGLIDGDGTISLSKHARRVHPCLMICISNSSKRLMKFLKGKYGRLGKVYRQRKSTAHHKTMMVFQFNAVSHQSILEGILPFLHIKDKQAMLCLELLRTKNWSHGKRTPLLPRHLEIWRRVVELNQVKGRMQAFVPSHPLEPKRTWTEQQKNFLIANYAVHSANWIAKRLDKTAKAVKVKSIRLALYKRGPYRK